MKTKFVKRYTSPIDYVFEQHRADGVIRQVKEDNEAFKDWLSDSRNILEIIPYKTPEPKAKFLEDVKKEKKAQIFEWYQERTNLPLKVNDEPPVYIKQTEIDLALWENGVKGFLFNAYDYGYFVGENALTEEEILDLFAGTIRGSILKKAGKYAVNPIDYFGKPLYIDLQTMVAFTLKMAKAFQTNFMKYHILRNFVDYADSIDKVNYLTSWETDLSIFGFPPAPPAQSTQPLPGQP